MNVRESSALIALGKGGLAYAIRGPSRTGLTKRRVDEAPQAFSMARLSEITKCGTRTR